MIGIKRILIVFSASLVFNVLVFSGCADRHMKARDTGALAGGALGAGLGAIVGNQVGHPGAGVAIGGAFGAIGGGLIGNGIDNQDDRLNENDRRLADQDRELEENRRLLSELRANGIDARETSRGVVMNLPDVLFEFDSSRLTRSAERKISDIANALRRTPSRSVAVEGHTDSVGTVPYNQRLSDDRARSVAEELSHDGIPQRRMSVHGFGESRPIASNSTESGRGKNRRVEVILERQR